METDKKIAELLGRLKPITLAQMSDIRLMNRTDTKFVTSKEKLMELLEMADGKYKVSITYLLSGPNGWNKYIYK